MSGISSGSIFFTPAVMILAAANAADKMLTTTAKCVFAGAIAVHNYKKKKDTIKIKKMSGEIGELNDSVKKYLFSQTGAFEDSTEKMIENIKNMHTIVSQSMSNGNIDEFKKLLHETEKNTLQCIEKTNTEFQKKYTETVNRSNAEIAQGLSALRENIFNQIKHIDQELTSKDILAKQRAEELVTNAKELLDSSYSEAARNHIHNAEKDIQSGNYQTAISMAASAITEIYMNIYKNDADEKEYEFYHQSYIFLIAEIKEYLENLKETEYRTDENSDDIMIIDLTQFMDGQYEKYLDCIEKTEKKITEESSSFTLHEIKKETELLNHLYADITESVVDAFYLMTYNLSRMGVEKEIYTVLKEKGFTLTKSLYSNGDPSKASERTYKCNLTDEELTISIVPYTDCDNEIKTDIIIKSNDTDCSEDSREQYRKNIINNIKENCSQVDSVHIRCHENTRNKNASDVDTSSFGIANPQQQKQNQQG